MKRLAALASLLVLLAIWVPSAEAANGGATVTTYPVTWVMSSATCSFLPAGTTVTGSGTAKSITTVRTDANGVTTTVNQTHAHGTATDQAGNTYVFNYGNHFRLSNTAVTPNVLSGTMVDVFSLAGNGPARLHNGFVADLTTDPNFASVTWGVRQAWGDPISFAPGPIVQRCDPL